jgi:predicted phage baseplate assembly protein
MPLTVPKLDDRTFQDIVDEAKKLIPHYCKEWTDHNLSDPGITLIELFAWMTDIILYRLNQVPDLHYIKMMELLGITLQAPEPAKVPITFWLAEPQPTPMVIPAGTEVSSTQTETEQPVIFTTDADFRICPPVLKTISTRTTNKEGVKTFKEQNLQRLAAGFEGFEVFTETPQVDDALYFGLENDLSHHILACNFDFDPAGGAGIDPTQPPYLWEASTGDPAAPWQVCEVEKDDTRGMNSAGVIQIFLPKMGRYKSARQDLFWIRARVKEISSQENKQGMQPYKKTPWLRKVSLSSWGGTIPSTHAQKVSWELIGQSDGSPGQRFKLKNFPILNRQPGEQLSVQNEGEAPKIWTEVSDFASSSGGDLNYSLESVTGELRFGPAIRQPDGTVKLYGSVPPRGANLIFQGYRIGGGQEGNVQAYILNVLKTSIPYVSRVTNRESAWGGLDAEDIQAAKIRTPALLRSRGRAVTESDFEFLARQALPATIGRVKCLQPRPSDAGRVVPGQVYVLVIPRASHPEGFLSPEQLVLDEEDCKLLSEYLDERRLLTTRVDIRPPAYHWVAVKVKLRVAPGVSRNEAEKEVKARLFRFLNPLVGGPDGKGWPFGRELFVSDIYQCLQGLPGVQFIRGAEMYQALPGGQAQGDSLELLEVYEHGVIASGMHEIEYV